MRVHVPLEILILCRTVPAPRDLTGVGALPRVSAHMRLELATLRSTVATPRDLTGKLFPIHVVVMKSPLSSSKLTL